MKICIDPGHYQNYNHSPAVAAYYEGNQVWILYGHLKTALEKYGVSVTCTKATINGHPKNADGTDDVVGRGKLAAGCDLFLSLHSNAVGSGVNDSTDYPCVFYPISGQNKQLAVQLANAIAQTMQTRQAGQALTRINSTKTADYYGVIRGAASVGCCGMILEHSFHTNTSAANWLMSDSNLKKLAQAEADVIAAYYQLKQTDKSRYETVGDIHNATYRKTIDKLVKRGLLVGRGGDGEARIIDLSEDTVRTLVVLDRAGVFD